MLVVVVVVVRLEEVVLGATEVTMLEVVAGSNAEREVVREDSV